MTGKMLIRNEARLIRRHPLSWLAMIGTALMAVMFSRGAIGVPTPEAVFELLRLNLLIPVIFLPIIAGAIAPIILLREVEHGMDEMTGSYPLTPRRWLSSRVGALFAALLSTSLVAQLVFFAIVAGDQPTMASSLALSTFLWTLTVHAPACLLWSAGLAWLACKRAHSGLIYVAAGFGWIAYLGLATVTGTPLIAGSFVLAEPLRGAMLLLDPYAASGLLERSIDPAYRTLLIGLGRAVWVVAALLLLRSIGNIPANAGRGREQDRSLLAKLLPAIDLPEIPSRGLHFWLHLKFVIRDLVFPLLFIGWVVIAFTGVLGGIDYAEPLSRIAPDSRDALGRIVWNTLPPVGALLLIYLADRICRLYPATRMNELYAASPHRAWSLVTVQVGAMLTLVLALTLMAGVSAMAAQVVAGSPVSPGEYGLQLGPFASRMALFAMLFVALHALIRSRLVANLLAFATMAIGTSRLLDLIGLSHPLLRPIETPLQAPDHYWGYGGMMAGHNAFMLFWAAIAAALLTLGVVAHHRTLTSVQQRLAKRLTHPLVFLAVLFGSAATYQGHAIHRSLEAEGALITSEDRVRWRANYELRYAQWADIAQPDIAAISSRIDFDPELQSLQVAADLQLLNRSDEVIERILVGRNQRTANADGTVHLIGATLVEVDDTAGQRIYVLDSPLAPGGSVILRYEARFSQSGLAEPEMPLILSEAFSMFGAFAYYPVVGFESELIVRNPIRRRDFGLPPLEETPPSQLAASTAALDRELVMLDTIVSTRAGHIPVAQGRLIREWTENGQSFAYFRTNSAIRNLPAAFSMPTEQASFNIAGVNTSLYAPEPIAARDPNRVAIADTIGWLQREVAPYPGSELHYVAVPDLGFSGFALPQIVLVSNDLAFRAEPTAEAEFSQPYRRAAHEVGHQWFGHLLGHSIDDERAFLVESFAKYVELVMVERRFGKSAAEALVEWEWSRYRQSLLSPEARIVPLIDGETQADQYSRATIVFACARERFGDAPILAAARELAERSSSENSPQRSLDFVNTLRSSVIESDRLLVDALFLGDAPLEEVVAAAGCELTRSIKAD